MNNSGLRGRMSIAAWASIGQILLAFVFGVILGHMIAPIVTRPDQTVTTTVRSKEGENPGTPSPKETAKDEELANLREALAEIQQDLRSVLNQNQVRNQLAADGRVACWAQTEPKKWIFGLGTGKCGTHVLAALMNAQSLASVTHERGGCNLVPWDPQDHPNPDISSKSREKLLDLQIQKIFSDPQRDKASMFVGDIALYWLPWVELLMKRFPEAKFIAVKRDREDTIESWMKWVPRTHHWISDPVAHNYQRLPVWDQCYPKFEILDRREAIAHWWDYYYQEVDRLTAKYPEKVRTIQIEKFATNYTMQDEILTWVGMCPPYVRVDTDHPVGQNVNGFSVLAPKGSPAPFSARD